MTQGSSRNNGRAVAGREWHSLEFHWVPGTMDRVRVGGDGAVHPGTITVNELVTFVGRDAVNQLYLRGLAQLECDEATWRAIKRSVATESP